MGKWTRRAFITTGLVAGGGVVVGISMRPGNQVKELAGKVGNEGGQLIHSYVKIDSENVITAIIVSGKKSVFCRAFGNTGAVWRAKSNRTATRFN